MQQDQLQNRTRAAGHGGCLHCTLSVRLAMLPVQGAAVCGALGAAGVPLAAGLLAEEPLGPHERRSVSPARPQATQGASAAIPSVVRCPACSCLAPTTRLHDPQ